MSCIVLYCVALGVSWSDYSYLISFIFGTTIPTYFNITLYIWDVYTKHMSIIAILLSLLTIYTYPFHFHFIDT